MGTYRQPGRVVDTSLNQANKQVAAGINKFDALFAKRKEERKIEAAKNDALLKEQQLQKAQGYGKWQENLASVRPEGGYGDENIRRQIDDWGEEYYSLVGRTDPQSLKRMGQLMSLPKQIAEYKGAMTEGLKGYETAVGIQDGAPGSVDPWNSSNMGLEYYKEAYNNNGENFVPGETDGVFTVGLGDHTMNGSAFVRGSLDGKDLYHTTGDEGKAMDPTITDITGGIAGYDKGVTVTKKMDKDRNVITETDRTATNALYKEKLKNFDYTKTLGQEKYMTSIFPSLIKRVETLATSTDDPEMAQKARIALYGEDEKEGGGDDYSGFGVGDIGEWVGSNPNFSESGKQQDLAKLGFYAYGTQPQFLKPDITTTGKKYEKYVASGTGSGSDWYKDPKQLISTTTEYTKNVMEALNSSNEQRFEHISIDGKTYNDVDIKIVPLTNKLTLTYDTGKEMKEIVTVPGEDGAKDEQVESIQYETIDGITKPKTKKTTKEYDWNKENVTTLVTQLVKGDPQFSDGEEKAISKQVEKVVVYLMKNHFTSKSIDPNSGDISSGLMSDLNNAESNVDTEEYEDFVE